MQILIPLLELTWVHFEGFWGSSLRGRTSDSAPKAPVSESRRFGFRPTVEWKVAKKVTKDTKFSSAPPVPPTKSHPLRASSQASSQDRLPGARS